MIFVRFYDEGLAQASYLIGCSATGESIIVDPNRDLDQYLDSAAARGLRITAVTETHIHADFVSGARELAARTGATLYLSSEGGKDWQYQYASGDGATLVGNGAVIQVGNVRLEARHTPGHTPEHLAFLVTDGASATEPMGALTGDFLFVGDVGRPDLLERAARQIGTADQAARVLFRSLQAFKSLPDYLQIWPGHGAGSACGKGLSPVPQSSLGYEKRFNWAFSINDEDEFVRMVLAGQPEPPRYFARMKQVNRDGPEPLGGFPQPRLKKPGEIDQVLAAGAIVLDLRPGKDYAAGHIPGTWGIPWSRSFTTYAGSLLPADRQIDFIVEDANQGAADRAARALVMIGFDRLGGVFDRSTIDTWTRSGKPLVQVPSTRVHELAGNSSRYFVLDVRGQGEWEESHLNDATHIPLGDLPDRLEEIPRDRPVVAYCQSGSRSLIAAGVLQSFGYRDVSNLAGGIVAWHQDGRTVRR